MNKIRIVVPLFNYIIIDDPKPDIYPNIWDCVTVFNINEKNRINICERYSYHNWSFRKLKGMVIPSDVPNIQFYYRIAGYFNSEDLSVLNLPIIDTTEYQQKLPYRITHIANVNKWWDKWCHNAVIDVLATMKYEELTGNLIPFKDFIVNRTYEEYRN